MYRQHKDNVIIVQKLYIYILYSGCLCYIFYIVHAAAATDRSQSDAAEVRMYTFICYHRGRYAIKICCDFLLLFIIVIIIVDGCS